MVVFIVQKKHHLQFKFLKKLMYQKSDGFGVYKVLPIHNYMQKFIILEIVHEVHHRSPLNIR